MLKIKRYNKATAATLCATVALALFLGGCKGRTMENMEPTGDTVEIDPTAGVTADSAAPAPAAIAPDSAR